jgi:hypothetical protein
MLTIFGAVAVTFMTSMYALEHRHRGFVLAFACGCALASAYACVVGAWPLGIVEALWVILALRRFTGSTRDVPHVTGIGESST